MRYIKRRTEILENGSPTVCTQIAWNLHIYGHKLPKIMYVFFHADKNQPKSFYYVVTVIKVNLYVQDFCAVFSRLHNLNYLRNLKFIAKLWVCIKEMKLKILTK